jgi:hypothetical protein
MLMKQAFVSSRWYPNGIASYSLLRQFTAQCTSLEWYIASFAITNITTSALTMITYEAIGVGTGIAAVLIVVIGYIFFQKSTLRTDLDAVRNEQNQIKLNYIGRFDEIKGLLHEYHVQTLMAQAQMEQRFDEKLQNFQRRD